MHLVVKRFRSDGPALDVHEEAVAFPFEEVEDHKRYAHITVEIPGEAPLDVQAHIVGSGEIVHISYLRNLAILADFAGSLVSYHHAVIVLPSGYRVAASVERRGKGA